MGETERKVSLAAKLASQSAQFELLRSFDSSKAAQAATSAAAQAVASGDVAQAAASGNALQGALAAADVPVQPQKKRLPAWATFNPPSQPAASQTLSGVHSMDVKTLKLQQTQGVPAFASASAVGSQPVVMANQVQGTVSATAAVGTAVTGAAAAGAAADPPARGTTSLAARLEYQKHHGRTALHALRPQSALQADAPAPAAAAAPATAHPEGALGAAAAAAAAVQVQEQQQRQAATGSKQAGPQNQTVLQAATAADIWDTDSEEEHEQDQQQQEQEEEQLTLQQRQQRQLAQLGVTGGIAAAAAAEEDRWLMGVLGAAGSGGNRGGRGTRGRSGSGGSGGGSSGGGGRVRRGSNHGSGGATAASAAGAAAGAAGLQDKRPGDLQTAAIDEQQQQQHVEMVVEPGPTPLAAVLPAQNAPEPLELFDPDSGLRLQVPGSINQHLRSYQKQGVEFLFKKYAAGKGGVLCDDMGLGKTVQAISFMAALLGKQGTIADALPRSFAAFRRQRQQQRQQRWLRQQHQQQELGEGGEEQEEAASTDNDQAVNDANATIRWPLLVVCPTSVLDNWMRELQMWGTFKAVKYHGPPAAREALADEASSGKFEVILTSYDTLRVDVDNISGLMPHAVIFDEVHKLKNPKSKQYEAAMKLPTKYRYGLSGTIMQNDWDELYAVLDLLSPSCLGDYGGFVDYYSKPIKRGQSSTASQYEVTKAQERRRQLVDVVRKVALRRTKAIIADQLPRKTDNVVFCQLKPLQYRAYDRTLASPDVQALRLAKDKCDCGSGEQRGKCCHSFVPASAGGVLWPHYHCCDCHVEGCKRHRPDGCQEYFESLGYTRSRLCCPYCLMLPALSLLRKISNHLELIRPDPCLQEQDEGQFEFELEVAKMVLGPDADALGGLVANSSGWLGASDETHCGKMATLKLLLRTWSGDYSCHNKVLVFSHSTRCLDLLEAFVQREGYDYLRLDGTTPQKHRQGICEEFNSRPSIFLLLMSTVAGGLGLNLTAANKVVVFDPHWNPAHDLQAQDRAYRLGQTRDVAVYRLVGTGTLEEAVYRRQIYKQQQSNMVIDDVQEPRYWEGVQGDDDKKGELWGLWNLLRFSGQTVETRDILQAYKGQHRQQLEQQLQQDAAHYQQQQQAEAQIQQQQQGPKQEQQPRASGSNSQLQLQSPPAASAAETKPFKIVVVDQLVEETDGQAAGGVALGEGGSRPGSAGQLKKRKQQQQQHRQLGRSSDAASEDSEGGEHFGHPAAAAAVDDHGWGDDDTMLEGLMDDLLPGELDIDSQQQQRRRKRQRRKMVLDEEDNDEVGTSSQHKHGTAAAAAGLGALETICEGKEEGRDGGGGGGEKQGFPVLQDSDSSPASPGSSAEGSDGAAGATVTAQTLLMDPVFAALREEGAVLHIHRHDKVLGHSSPTPEKHQKKDKQPRTKRGSTKAAAAVSHAPGTQDFADATLGGSPVLRRSLAVAIGSCSQTVVDAAEAAAMQGWDPIASLAVWQGRDVVEMAHWLLCQTVEERRQLLSMYVTDLS